MIKQSNRILAQSFIKAECILMQCMQDMLTLDEEGKLSINSAEEQLVRMNAALMQVGLDMVGSVFSNKVTVKTEWHCDCGKKMVLSKRDAQTHILSTAGNIPVTRDMVFCRRCHEGHGVVDKELEIYGEHRMTKAMTETVAYVAQLVPSFERASEMLKKLLKIEVSTTQIQIVSEEVGKKVFEKEKVQAQKAHERPEEAAPQAVTSKLKDGKLYILTDGLQVNTRVEENGSTWKEMKLGLIFSDKDVIRRGDGSHTITKKEYVSYFGSVNEFKKFVFAAAARAGYGKIKETIVIGDGAPWIWNMCEELFPDAVRILDFYHLSENVHSYARYLYPEDEVGRKKWVKIVLDAAINGKVDEAVKCVEERRVAKTPEGVVNLYNYITNNRGRIDYKAYKEKGYYIGSGAIESANKMVIQQRMKQSGMRWSINGGQYIAALRTKHESGLWEDVVREIYA